MVAREDDRTRRAVDDATLAVPDGQPLVWALHALGHPRATRVYGPDLMLRFCAHAARGAIPMYLYGGRTPPPPPPLPRRGCGRLPRPRPAPPPPPPPPPPP